MRATTRRSCATTACARPSRRRSTPSRRMPSSRLPPNAPSCCSWWTPSRLARRSGRLARLGTHGGRPRVLSWRLSGWRRASAERSMWTWSARGSERDADLRDKRDQELEAVAAEHRRRLDDLKTAQARELEQLRNQTEQACSHVKRMQDSELSTLRMQLLQKKREKVHRLEQDFVEVRQSLEQQTVQMGFELEQQKQEMADVAVSCATTRQQVDALQASLDEMTRQGERAEEDAQQARAEAEEAEVMFGQLQSEVAVLQVRQRAAGVGDAPPPPLAGVVPSAAAAAAAQAAAAAVRAEAGVREIAADLAAELREAIVGLKASEAELGNADSELAALDDELTEREKEVEILEVEIEEEQLRTHQLQVRLLEREAALKG
mmetsp:Transcript_86579/g.279498  ORF Transcript_86579/g.279498 Transcript_86579/m.279498 type:complete len:377 (+) Transcript_86579:261-1391(+)